MTNIYHKLGRKTRKRNKLPKSLLELGKSIARALLSTAFKGSELGSATGCNTSEFCFLAAPTISECNALALVPVRRLVKIQV